MVREQESVDKKIQDIYSIDNNPILQGVPAFDPANRVTLSWHNINVFLRPPKKWSSSFKNQYDVSEQKQLLHNVSGEVRPGQLLAIMGASGAGKTTLLNVLTGRNHRGLTVNGEVLVNGKNVGASMARVSAYIQQDDLFIGTLTVREHLVFQALLRMDKHLSYKERMRRVGEVIEELGLSKCADTLIGFIGGIKGISGGEMKRLALAAEVLTNPALMFCDEPTSGLDSFMAQNIATLLKDMAAGGRTIICTIHQPSSEVYELFDNLLLMAEGRVAYMGRAKRALEFFERAGLRCPVNYNPADFFVHNLAIVPGEKAKCEEKVMNICMQFQKESSQFEKLTSSGYFLTENHLEGKTRYKASWCDQLKVISRRSWISLVREPIFTRVRFIQNVIVATLLGLIYLNQKVDDKGVMNINGAIFVILLEVTYRNAFAVINVFCLERAIFLREHWNGMYRTDVYFLSKTIVEIPFLIVMTTITTTILYWMTGLNPHYEVFLLHLVIILLIANTVASFGYMMSCVSSSVDIALTIGTALLMPLMLFGGFFLNNASVPIYFVWIKYLSWFHYGNEALLINQWSSITNITCTDSDEFCPPDGKAVLKKLNFDDDNLLFDICSIVVLLVFFRTIAFIALLIKACRKT